MTEPHDSKSVSKAPLATALKQRLASLSPEKLAALQRRLQQQKRSGYEPIPALPNEAVYPLSFHQRRLWFVEQFQPGTPLYNVTRAIRMCGPLNRRALKSALQSLLDRHEALRTTFHMLDGGPVQRISAPSELQLPVIDLQTAGQGSDSAKSLLEQRLTAEGRRVFDLSSDLMLRAVLFQLADDEHVLQLTIHHLACDGWSLRLLFNELAVLYGGFCSDRMGELPPMGLRYVDFARWQREPQQLELFEDRVQWWKRRLAGAPPVLELVTDRPRPQIESGSGANQPLEIPSGLLEQLEMFAREEDATLYMTLLTGFFILLHRYTGMEDFLVGSATAGRHRPETHGIVGFFVDTVVLRADLSDEPTARQVLQRARQTVIDAVQHSDVPFDRVVESLDLPRDLSRHPLFQVLFNAPPQYSLELHDLNVSPIDVDLQVSRFDLEMTYSDGANRTTGVTWNTDLLSADTIQRMLGHYCVVLKALAQDPDRRISELPLLTERERHQLLVEWNDTAVEYPAEKCVHELFEQQVQRTPDAVAVVFEDQQLTYHELNRRANQLAHHLIDLGVEPETLVGLCLQRSPELVIGILGILKAGGAYVPLDADYPQERLQFMLQDAAVEHLVTQKPLFDRLPSNGCRVTCLDRDAVKLEACDCSNPNVNVSADNLAYVMYTSGSTGQPKGVAIRHTSIARLVLGNDYATFGPDRVFLQLATASFDASTFELWGALLHGAKLVVAPVGLPDYRQLEDLLKRNRVTTLWLTATLLNQVVEHYPQALNSVDEILTGGEALSVQHICTAHAALGSRVQFINGYGPTENTTFTTCYRIPSHVAPEVESIPIGRPIANTQVYVLDAQRHPVPIGVPGELYIGGAGLARGYLNRPELTAEKFIRNPFADDPASRLYGTGDLCRWRADGNLDFLGRLDDQVKLRGFRIEPGEIETALNEHPAVAQGVVTLRDNHAGERRLVAYCVPAADGELDFSELRSHLHSRLPDYMLPAAFVGLETLPLTPSGKVDRRALPAPDDSRPELESGYVAPRNPIEQQLTSIWCDVLGIENIGIHDNFFALGGHSLLVTRVNARIASVLQVDLPLRRLFEAPTIGELATEIEMLRSGGQSTRGTNLKRVDREQPDRLPLSFAQQRLWFLEQMEGELMAYNMPFAWRLRGTLHRESLRRALEAIVRRHEPLRTTFAMIDDEPVQVIGTIARFELPFEDLSGLGLEHQETEIARRCRWEGERPFDLTGDRMLRASLLRLADDEHVLLLTMHHIASDGWSLRVLWRELELLYDAFCRDADAGVAELPVQYADYAVWQRKELAGQRLERLLQYWRGQLDGVGALELPTDRPRPALLTYRGARHNFELPEELVDQLKSLGQVEGVTLHMTLLAAFETLLARYSGQEDIAVGTPIAGRNHAELEDQIGFFVNTLVLRTDLSENPTFRELLGRVRQVSLAAYDHQDLPFEKLVEELQPQRHLSRSPLVQVLFQLLSFSDQELALGELEVSRLPPSNQRVRFDLEMHLWQQPKTLHGAVVYSTDLFDASTIERMVGHFVTLLEGIVADADQRLGELPLLTERERRQLLVEWNDTAADYPRDQCVHELFEQQVQRTPDAVAVIFEDQELTYRQLNQRANQLAHHLRSLGVGPETLVGLCLQRSPELVVAILGILKAGGAYVPLDADYPQERLQFMLQDAAVEHLVTQQPLLDRLPSDGCRATCLDRDAVKLEACDCSKPSVDVRANNLAYVMYTSGSTGIPKGVAVSHDNVSNLLMGISPVLEIDTGTRFLGIASPTFDISVAELLLPLVSGATTVLVRNETARDAYALARTIASSQPHIVQATPASWVQLLDSGWSGSNELTLVSTGEALPRSLAPRLLEACGILRDFYGPTETTIWSTVRHVTDVEVGGSIGRPIANTQVYVLDEDRQLVPIGVPGELYIGGAGLARGYLNRPELTAERFVANPFSDDPASRLYRTGDLCRWRGDGNLQFLGRLDDQVKLRGFRIEPGEIETVLNEHSHVAQSVVSLREDRAGDKRLVAYCVPAADSELDFSELRSHLRSRLPDYMVPAGFVGLDTLPLTPSGKVDRRALPAPDDSRPELESEYVAPRNPTEEQLASLWCEVLGVERVGIHDNFFALGGHSLLATRVNARIASALQVDLPLRRLFEAPTIAELATEIETLRSGGRSTRGTNLKRVDREQLDRLPLSFAQQRLWFLEQMEGELSAYNMPFAWRLRGTLHRESLRRALEAVVRRHESLRTTFAMIDDEPVQVIGTIERLELPFEDLRSFESKQQPAEIEQRCRLEAVRPFDLAGDRMLRARLLHLGEDEHLLLLTMHHIASDGWSLRVLWRELELLYDAFCRDAAADLPELPVQYADYAVWQRNELQDQQLARLLRYWRKQLDGIRVLELPTDRPRPPAPTYHGARHGFELKEELVEQLQSLSQREGVTLHMALLAAFETLLARYSGQEDIAVGTPIAGRNHAELEDQIGFFVNTLVLRTDLSGNPTFRELLGRVRQVSLAAYDHQDLPFEKLVEELQPQRHLSRSPLVQVLFQLLSFSDQELALGELEVSRLPPSSQRVRFDLEMHLWQQPKQLRGAVVYSTDLFDASTIERMVGHFVTLLEGIVADADQRISELPLLTDVERRQLLVEWNDTAADYPRDQCVHELFEQQVQRTPDAVAVIFEDQELTYRQLNQRANQLAHHLRSLGVGPETLVGLCLQRSPELVVAILGILKAGGAYVPLDADYPQERLQFMLQDAAVEHLVTQQPLLDRLPSNGCRVTCLDRDAVKLEACDCSKPSVDARANNLAYVMYTSGSTGTPKGVAMPHAALVNLIDWHRHDPDLMQPARTLQFASCNFDVSFQEMLTTWCCGGTLILISEVSRRDPSSLWKVIVESRVERLFVPYVALQQLATMATAAAARLRDIVSAGEALHLTPEIRHLVKGIGNARLHNHYGPTESHVVTSMILGNQSATWPGEAPIGRPIANTQVYVLDEDRQLVPIGVPGELYIGGAGLARGYLNRPELTAEKFIRNPFADDPASRFYRTGDLCRWREDGNLEFLGRLDHQIKLRGYRIELGEIESVLNEHPDVAQSVVTLGEDRGGDKRLVAYCVPAADSEVDFPDLRSHLRSRLPDYMVPAAFVGLETLPLTPSGKINRRALPDPDDSRPQLETGYVAPRNSIEEQLASIWCELLALDRIGVDDDFFELGGHSLLAVRLVARIEKSFGRKLPLAVLFQHGTIRHIAKLLAEPDPAMDTPSALPLQPNGDGRPLFLMPSIGGELLFSRALIENLGGRFPVIGIQPALATRNPEQFRDFRTTAGLFVRALQAYQPHGPYALAGYSYGGLIAFEVACLLTELGENVDLLAVIDTGPGRRGLKPQFGDRARRLSRIVANLPFWLREEFRQFSASELTGRVARKLRRFYRLMASAGRATTELDDIFDASFILSHDRELLRAVFAAFRDYVPRRYAGRITLFRANTRPLLSGCPNDLGWGRFADALEVRQINGDHVSILHSPHVGELARQLAELLDDLPSCPQPAHEKPKAPGTDTNFKDAHQGPGKRTLLT